jgi:superfamily II DNA or RNA helicase
MSFDIALKDLSTEWKAYIKSQCIFSDKPNKYTITPTTYKTYCVNDGIVSLPLYLWNDMFDDFPNEGPFSKIDAKFEGKLLEESQRDQQTVIKTVIERLEKKHSVLMALRTGFGKTMSALYLICHFGVKAVLLCHVSTLHEQWVKEAKKFCPNLKIQILEGNKKFDPDADMYIMGIIKSTHYDKKTFKNIGMVIVDEAHLTLTNTFTESLLNFKPKYLIGLSATPDRKDGMHRLLFPFFGKQDTFIIREEVKDFIVIKYKTIFKPEIKTKYDGTLDWTHVVKSIACNEQRQRFAVSLMREYKNHKILALSDRVCEVIGCTNYSKCTCRNKSKGIVPLLKEVGENVDYRAENKSTHNEDSRIVVGTFQKLGVGYDSKRNLIMFLSDKTDVRQNEGRGRGADTVIIDLVDSFKPFESHWKQRELWYKKRGATILYKEMEQKIVEDVRTAPEIY